MLALPLDLPDGWHPVAGYIGLKFGTNVYAWITYIYQGYPVTLEGFHTSRQAEEARLTLSPPLGYKEGKDDFLNSVELSWQETLYNKMIQYGTPVIKGIEMGDEDNIYELD